MSDTIHTYIRNLTSQICSGTICNGHKRKSHMIINGHNDFQMWLTRARCWDQAIELPSRERTCSIHP